MNLFEATLDLARFVGDVYRGSASGGSTNTLNDSVNPHRDGYYDGGTLWVITGPSAGKVVVISSYSSKTFKFSGLSAAIASGNQYAAIPKSFPLNILKDAINQALAFFPVEKYDTTMVVTVDNNEYTLPAGVRSVKKVEIATFLAAPYGFCAIPWWKEINGKLEILDGIFLDDANHKIRLTYTGYHGEVGEDGAIDSRIAPEYLRYGGAVWLWRNYIQKDENDNPIAPVMFNEAKMLEAQARLNALHLMPYIGRDTRGASLP